MIKSTVAQKMAHRVPLSARRPDTSSSDTKIFSFKGLPENLNDSVQESVGSNEQVMAEKPKTTSKKVFKHKNKVNLSLFGKNKPG